MSQRLHLFFLDAALFTAMSGKPFAGGAIFP
jgi:hypothetical protein